MLSTGKHINTYVVDLLRFFSFSRRRSFLPWLVKGVLLLLYRIFWTICRGFWWTGFFFPNLKYRTIQHSKRTLLNINIGEIHSLLQLFSTFNSIQFCGIIEFENLYYEEIFKVISCLLEYIFERYVAYIY